MANIKGKMNRTRIEYLDFTWNPLVGCSGIGCAVRSKCWAMAMSKRQKHKCYDCYLFKPHVHLERLEQPLRRKKPSRIGVCFMGDLFDHKCNSKTWHDNIIDITRKAHRHTFVFLTKQPQNIPDRLVFPENCWVGVTVNRKDESWRIEKLKEKKAKIKFVSFEPLYEGMEGIDLKGVDWIIIGAQTKPYLPPKYEWLNRLRSMAHYLKIPIFEKNNLNSDGLTILKQKYPDSAISRNLLNSSKIVYVLP